jgi:hypothetical protein
METDRTELVVGRPREGLVVHLDVLKEALWVRLI